MRATRVMGAAREIGAAALLLASLPALAVDAVAGKTLYKTAVGPSGNTCSSSSCHGANPASGANKILLAANNPAAIQTGISNDSGGMRTYSGRLTTADMANIAAFIGITGVAAPASLSYAALSVGATSAAQTVTVTSQGIKSLHLNSFSSSTTDFTLGGGTCVAGGNLAGYNTSSGAYASCTISVTFTPKAGGPRTATLSISTSDPSAPTLSIALSGTGLAGSSPLVQVTPPSLNFGSVAVGGSSAAQTATLANTGSADLTIAGIGVSPADYALTHNCPAALAAGASCTLSVTFTPAATGARNGTVTIGSNAASSPDTVALSGTGASAAAGILAWQPSASVTFPDTAVTASSAAQSLTLANTGNAAATLQALQLGGTAAGDFAVDPSSTCAPGGTVAAGASCTVRLVFTPSAAGARSGSLGVTSNASGPNPATLSGNGVTGTGAVLTLLPPFINLAAGPNAGLQPQSLTLQNDGAAVLSVAAIQAAPGIALLYAGVDEGWGGTCNPPPFDLAPGAACSIVIAPTDIAPANSTITVTSNAAPAQATVSAVPLKNVGAASGALDPAVLLPLLLGAALARRRAPTSQGAAHA